MKTALSFGTLNNNNNGRSTFSKGKIIVGNVSSNFGDFNQQPTLKAFKSKFATQYLPNDVTGPFSQPKTIQDTSIPYQHQHLEQEYDQSSDSEENSPRNSNIQSNASNTTNNSLNTTFSGFYHKLLGREKRKPQCTPPIRTVVCVGILKDHNEKQLEQRQNNPESFAHNIADETKKFQTVVSEKPTRQKVSWEDEPTFRNSQQTHQEEEKLFTSESKWMDFEIGRMPSLGPVMRSVYIKKQESLVGDEENTRTRFVGEVDNRRLVDLDWKNKIEKVAKPRKSAVPSSRTVSVPKPPNINPSTQMALKTVTHSSSSPNQHENDESTSQTKFPTQSKRIFNPTKRPNLDKDEEEEQERSNNPEPRKIDRKSFVQKNTTPQILDENSLEKFKHITRWIENDLGIEFISSIQCENDLRTGLKFAEIVARVEGEGKMKGINKQPQTTAAMHNNIERVFSVLRENKTIELQYLWSTKEVISGDYDTVWGLLNDIYDAYWKKTTKVKRSNRKRENSRLTHSLTDSFEEDEQQQEGFSIDEINRMKRELLESSQ